MRNVGWHGMHSILLLVTLFGSFAYGAPVRVERECIEGVIFLDVDEAKVNVDALRRYLDVHPTCYDAKYHIARQLPLCVEGEPGYKPCGTRDLRAAAFFDNAVHNLALSRKDLKWLETLNAFPELAPLVSYFQRSLCFSLWQNERLLAYYKTWNVSELEQTFESLPILAETKDIIVRLKQAKDIDLRWHISYYEWQNATNHLYRAQEGPVPAGVWATFLHGHGIKESVEYEEVD